MRRLVYEGDPESQIAAFAQGERVELVVMPTHGYGVLRRYLIGSVTAKVLHDVNCPVLTGVHMEYEARSAHVRFSNMVCALDLNSRSRETLAWASKLATDFAAKLHVVHVVPSPSPGLYAAFSSSLQQEIEERAREDIRKLQIELAADSVSICIQEGDVARQVCSFTHSIGAELLIIGRGAQGDKIERLRTNAYAIIRQAPCPVFSV